MTGGRPSLAVRVAAPATLIIVVVIALEVALRLLHVPAYVLPTPSRVAWAAVEHRQELGAALGWTALAAVGGFVASGVVGVVLGLVLSLSPTIRRAAYPYTVFFQTVPIIAIAPMLVNLIGFGLRPVVVCAFLVSVFPVIINTLSGLQSTDPALIDLFRLYHAGTLTTIWKLRLPSALPSIFAGLRIAAGLAVIGTIVAEFVVGESIGRAGLGVLIMVYAAHYTDRSLAAVLLSSLLGLALFGLTNLAGWMVLHRWHASEK